MMDVKISYLLRQVQKGRLSKLHVLEEASKNYINVAVDKHANSS
jgi:hypothetical protein